MLLVFECMNGVLVRDPRASVMALGAVNTSLDKHREKERRARCKMQENNGCFLSGAGGYAAASKRGPLTS